MYARTLFSLSLLGLLSACGLLGDKDNTKPPAPLAEFTPSLSLQTRWQADTGAGSADVYLKLAPVVSKGRVFTASPSGEVRAFALDSGELVWKTRLDMKISGGPGVGDDLVVVGSHSGKLVALAMEDGSQRWSGQVSSEVLAPPHVAEGMVSVRTVDGRLTTLKALDGVRMWSYQQSVPILSVRGTGTPLRVRDMIISGFDNGKLVALEAGTGKPLWEATVATPKGRLELERMVDVDAPLALMDHVLYATSFQGRTAAVAAASGEVLWQRESSAHAGLAVDAEAVYLSDAEGHLWALDRYTGESLWKQTKLEARAITAPVILGSYLVVGDLEGYLHWLRRDDGQFVAREKIGKAGLRVTPVVYGDLVLALDNSGLLSVLSPLGAP